MNRVYILFLSIFLCVTTPAQDTIKDIDLFSSVQTEEISILNTIEKWRKNVWDKNELTVSFINGTVTQQAKVVLWASEWSCYCGMRFVWLPTFAPDSDIRINFSPDGSWSLVGKGAKNIPKGEPTMNFAVKKKIKDADFRRIVLHEFGHALGLEHEHLHPNAHLQLNKRIAYAVYEAVEGWSKEKVDAEVFNSQDYSFQFFDYDPKSIMHYSFSADWTENDVSHPLNLNISEGDKKKVSTMYPKR